jgi:CelD/BcsL family acetyltransferase involved in cellulose biosynthesis
MTPARVFHDLAAARAAAVPAGSAARASDLFSTWAWFENLAAHGWPCDAEPLFIVAGDAARLVCLPLAVQARGPAALYGPVVTALSNYYSSLFGATGEPGTFSGPAASAAVRALAQLGGAADVLDIQPLDIDGPFARGFTGALSAHGYLVDTYFAFGNWYLPCAGLSFADYFATLPSRVRNTVVRHRKKLDKHGPWTMEVHSEPGPGLERAIEQFVEVYGRSWKMPEPYPRFVPELCRTAAREGWLRLGVLQVSGQPAAAQMWLVHQRKALIYKLAYDEAYSHLSPGSVLSAELFRRALDDERVDEIDYLTGDDAYKRDWMRERRERQGLLAFRRNSVRGFLSASRHHVGRLIRAARAGRQADRSSTPEMEER